ncbi:macrophage mannose receptor 1-like [Micropterus salmoides]|uniref:macrophage mannose receptor 1-like n=1 Tax=Micropterus salmoides TaxID=27706 RepID=UPI0018EE239C|nr:macrophage mannose receptor 1-like [Micropterus salmoides]
MVLLLDYGMVIIVLTGALVNVASAQTRQYYFESTPLNWTEAQSFCRQVYTDLATIENTTDVSAVLRTTPSYTGKAWIGLYGDSWRWSLNDSSFYGEGETEFRNWAPGHTRNPNGQQLCVVLQSFYYYYDYLYLYYNYFIYNGKWSEIACDIQRPFVCYNGTANGTSSFVKVNSPLKWTEAQSYCRENYVDLASIRNRAENYVITKLTGADSVWIGLHWERLWSDGSTYPLQYWASGQPDSAGQCVTTSFRNSGLWSDDNCSLTFPFICYSTTPPKTEDFRSIGQDETSITLQWNKVNNNISFILQFNDAEINITAPDGDGPVTHTVSSLTAATEYTFTLFSVFENVRSSGVNITAVTAPPNAESFRSIGQDVTSITLQWNKVNNSFSFILQFNDAEINIPAPDGDGPVTHTVSSLTAATEYTFTLFSVFENVRSSGVNITAVTGTRQYNFVSTPLNWTEAQSFCRRVYTDLATVETITDTYAIFSTTSSYRGKAWIGLYDDNWRWSLSNSSFYGEGETEFRNWAPGHTRNPNGQQNCVILQNYKYSDYMDYYNGKWWNVNCNIQFYSVCYNGSVNGTSSFVKVYTPFNWTEAQRYCRENYVDLASIRNQAENDVITKLAAGDDMWIGLHLERLWSDGSTVLFQYWDGGQPDSTGQCVTTALSYLGQWSDDNCSLTFPFICYSTTPPNAENFKSTAQNETSITLQWNKVNNIISFILQFNDAEINITAPDGDGPVTHTVSSLTAATEYTFTLYSVFENVRSSGVNFTAVTEGPSDYVLALNVELESLTQLSDSDLQSVLEELFNQYGLSPQLSFKVLRRKIRRD